jgi:hypothetical protein
MAARFGGPSSFSVERRAYDLADVVFRDEAERAEKRTFGEI